MECLIDGKICSEQNKKCKVCKLDNCRDALNILGEQEKMWIKNEKDKLNKMLNRKYPRCVNCPFLEIRDLENKKLHCFYKLKGKCMLKDYL